MIDGVILTVTKPRKMIGMKSKWHLQIINPEQPITPRTNAVRCIQQNALVVILVVLSRADTTAIMGISSILITNGG